jgi:hypothetical protein
VPAAVDSAIESSAVEDSYGAPTATTAAVTGPGTSPAAPAAWDAGPATAAALRSSQTGSSAEAPSGADANGDALQTPLAAPAEPLSGEMPIATARAGTPIFDTVSMWFSKDAAQSERVIDLRDTPEAERSRESAARWSSLGDQRWLATTARAAAGPEVSGTTDVGLPRRRPGANLIPSAAAAAPVSPPAAPDTSRPVPVGGGSLRGDGRSDADAVRGRLSSYQRGLTSARRARHLPAERSGDGLFASSRYGESRYGESRDGENDPGHSPGEQGG